MTLHRTLRVAVSIVCAGASVAFADLRFVHSSDPHVNVNASASGNAAIDGRMLAEIAQLNPKPLVNVTTGDIVDYGYDVEYANLRKLTDAFPIPWRMAMGNHDVRWNPLGKEGFVRGTGQPTFQTFDVGGVQCFLLDSTVLLEHWGHISRQQLDWLKAELEKIGTEKPVVIGFHHWIGRETVQVDNEQELIELVEPYNVVLWLQGHGHNDLLWNVNGVPAIMQKGLYQGSYSVIDVVGGKLIISRRSEPKPTKKDELMTGTRGDKSAATRPSVGAWSHVGTFSMKPTTRPSWSVLARRENDSLVVNVPTGIALPDDANVPPLPTDAKLSARLGTRGESMPMKRLRDGQLEATLDATNMLAGTHEVYVDALLSDGRALRKVATVEHFPGNSRPAWQTPLQGAVQSRLVLADGALYVTTMAGELARIDPKTGERAWTFKAGDAIFSAPCISGDLAIVGSADHFVYAVNVNNGQVEWKHETDGAVLAGAAVADGVVCIASADTNIYGISLFDGLVTWKVKGGNLFQSVAATDGQRFYVGGWDNAFRCLNVSNGNEVWTKPLGRPQTMLPGFSAYAPAITSPAVADGLVYVSTNDGILHALNTSDGSEAWRIDRKKMGYSSPLVRDGVVYGCLSDESLVFAADAKTGAIKWERQTGHVVYDGGFAWAEGAVVIPCVDGTLIAYDAKTGDVAWQQRLDGGHLLSTPVADDGHLYAASMLGVVNAIPLKR